MANVEETYVKTDKQNSIKKERASPPDAPQKQWSCFRGEEGTCQSRWFLAKRL